MEFSKVLFISIFFSCSLIQAYCLDPLTATLVTSALSSIVYYLSSKNNINIEKAVKYIGRTIGYFEGCEDYWIPGNVAGLEYDLKANVFGQPLAVEIILSALKYHLNTKPNRALMLSFHGAPGTGKNFISQKILKNMFTKGGKSDFVHFFKGSIDFPLQSEIGKYKKIIVDTIREKVYECHRSIFVFDEVEKMPNGTLEVLSGFVSIGSHGDHDFRRVIFILLSNIGSDILLDQTLQNWHNEGQREDMKLSHLEKLLAREAFNTKGGLHQTGLIKNLGVTHYVPFLPLERCHVTQCLEKEVQKQGQVMSAALVERVFEHLTFGPEPNQIYAYGGCKGVGEKASIIFERESQKQRRRKIK